MKKVLLTFGLLFHLQALWSFIPAVGLQEDFTWGAEWLYFSPTSESIAYAILATGGDPTLTPARQEIIQNRFDHFNSGFRIFAAAAVLERVSVASRFTYLKAHHSSSISIPTPVAPPFTENLAPLLIGPSFSGLIYDRAEDSKDFSYLALDEVITFSIVDCPPLYFYLYTGLHYAHLRSKDAFFYRIPFVAAIGANQTFTGELRNSFNGVGPLVGAWIEKCLPWGFSLEGSFATALLVGKPRDENHYLQTDFIAGTMTSFNHFTSRPWRGVPYGDITLGLVYQVPPLSFCPRLHVFLEAGYEALVYYRALALIQGTGFFDDTSFRNVTLHGFYLSAAFSF